MSVNEISNMELPQQIVKFIDERRSQYPTTKAILIPALMECQKYFGQVTEEAAIAVSKALGVPYPEVQSVLSFYTMLQRKPTGEYIVGVCGTWNCENAGAFKLIEHFKQKYNTEPGNVTENGKFTLERLECLCDCSNAPSVQFLKKGPMFMSFWCNNLTVELFDQVLNELEAGETDALRERLVRVDEKVNPPDDKHWMWIVTTNNQYPVSIETTGEKISIQDGYGKLGNLAESNPKLLAEIEAALRA